MDRAHIETDKKLEQMERALSAIYSRAEKKTQKELSRFFEKHKPQADEILKEWKETGSAEAKQRYIAYFKNILKSKEFKKLSAMIANDLYTANVQATAKINATTAAIYALNYNFIGSGLRSDLDGYSFSPVSVKDADEYGEITKQELDKHKDTEWNKKNVSKSIIAGSMLMLATDRIVKRSAKVTAKKNKDSANLHASGMFTDAEAKGREDSMSRANDEGYSIKKTWQATLDNRTRDTHRRLDGKTIPLDAEFKHNLSRPRDPKGAPAEICNCRCTLQYRVGQSKGKTRAARSGDVKGSYKKSSSFAGTKTITVENMTYREWMKWRLK